MFSPAFASSFHDLPHLEDFEKPQEKNNFVWKIKSPTLETAVWKQWTISPAEATLWRHKMLMLKTNPYKK